MYFSTEVWAAQRTDENIGRNKAQKMKRQRKFTEECIRHMYCSSGPVKGT
jgi:hypothetical protein